MQKWCGISLTDALLMVPSKSITAFIGCTRQPKNAPDAAYLAAEINPLKLEADGSTSHGHPNATAMDGTTSPCATSTEANASVPDTLTARSTHDCRQCTKTDCLYRDC